MAGAFVGGVATLHTGRRLGAVGRRSVRRRGRGVVGRLRGWVVGRLLGVRGLLRVRGLVLVRLLRGITVLVAIHDTLRRNDDYRAL